jgi:hypothetical protein
VGLHADRLRAQVRAVGPAFSIAAGVLCAVYLTAYSLASAYDRNFVLLIEDPAFVFKGPLYTGAFVYLGVLGWWAAAVATGITGGLLAARGWWGCARPVLLLALVSTVLAVDDMFQLHEGVLDGRLGVPQYASFAAYSLVLAAFVWRNADFVRESDWLLLSLFVVFISSSAVLDVVGDVADTHHDAAEEGLELTGTLAWTLYCLRCALRYLTVVKPPRRDDSVPTQAAVPRV